eukprot:7023096-Pyramimonas_sp.AAC.1
MQMYDFDKYDWRELPTLDPENPENIKLAQKEVGPPTVPRPLQEPLPSPRESEPVSYTHLTLPTILLV